MENSLTIFDNQKLLPQLASANTQIMILQNSIKVMGDTGQQADQKMNWGKFHKGIQGATKAIQAINAPGLAFEQQMADLSAATGITGKDLNILGNQARKTGMASGLGATQAVNAYKVLTTQVDISKIGINGLNNLQQKTMTLAKASGMYVESAAGSLAATINGFGLKASEAGRAVNVLAAGAKYGSMDVNQLSQAFSVAGASASAAGVSMEATTGALGVLSQNNLKGAEAGEALSDIMQKMQASLGVDFSATSLSDALESLKPKLNDINYLNQVFGEKNSQAAQFLIANSAAVGEMTNMVTGSNVAQEQAAQRSQTMADRMDVIRQTVDDLKIGFFDLTGGISGYIGLLGEMAGQFTGVIAPIMEICKGMRMLSGIIAANPIGLLVTAIALMIGLIVAAVQHFESWGSAVLLLMGHVGLLINGFMIFKANWDSIVQAFKGEGIIGGLKRIGIVLMDVFLYPIQQLLELLGKIPGLSIAKEGAESIRNFREGFNLANSKAEGEEETAAAIEEEATGGATIKKGISTVDIPGANNNTLVPTNQTTSPSTVRQSSESAVTGGAKSTNVTINLGKFMDNVNIYAQEFRDGLNDLDGKVLDSLTRVLTIAQSSVG